MAEDVARLLMRWIDAGILDPATADRIRAFEAQHAGSSRLRWPIWLALALGALMLGAGVLLFISAHWDQLSPGARFTLVLLLVTVFHTAGAAMRDRFPGMATTLHTLGTVALGAGIFLAGQIFNLDEHWPGGLMLWALGAALAWAILGEWPQMALTAVLAPAWLLGEWAVATEHLSGLSVHRIPVCGGFLLALAYFTAFSGECLDGRSKVLLWLGGISLLPAAIFLGLHDALWSNSTRPDVPSQLRMVGWMIALGLPIGVSSFRRRLGVWPMLVAVLWTLVLIRIPKAPDNVQLYLWWALGAIGLAAWGVRDARSERINMGAAVFAATVMAFYSSRVMDKLGRSASLVGLGVLFLVGGWGLDRVRRGLIQQARRGGGGERGGERAGERQGGEA